MSTKLRLHNYTGRSSPTAHATGRVSSEVTKYFCLGSRPSDWDLSQSGRGGAHGAVLIVVRIALIVVRIAIERSRFKQKYSITSGDTNSQVNGRNWIKFK